MSAIKQRKAIWPAKCPSCGEGIEKGELIWSWESTWNHTVSHAPVCPVKRGNPSARKQRISLDTSSKLTVQGSSGTSSATDAG